MECRRPASYDYNEDVHDSLPLHFELRLDVRVLGLFGLDDDEGDGDHNGEDLHHHLADGVHGMRERGRILKPRRLGGVASDAPGGWWSFGIPRTGRGTYMKIKSLGVVTT